MFPQQKVYTTMIEDVSSTQDVSIQQDNKEETPTMNTYDQEKTPQHAMPQLPAITHPVSIKQLYDERKKYENYPEYQRHKVWPLKYAQWLINTILAGRTIPDLLAYTESPKGFPSYWIIDGKQRLSAILDFMDGKFRTWSITQKENAEPNSELPIEPATYYKNLSPLAKEYFNSYIVYMKIEPKRSDAEQRGRFRGAQNQYPLSAAEKIATYDSKAKDVAELIEKSDFWKDFYMGVDLNRKTIFQSSIYLLAIELSPDGLADMGGMSFLKTLASGKRDREISDALIERIFRRIDNMMILFNGTTFTTRTCSIIMYQATRYIEEAGIQIIEEHKGCLTLWLNEFISENNRPENVIGYRRQLVQMTRKRIQRAFWEKNLPRVLRSAR